MVWVGFFLRLHPSRLRILSSGSAVSPFCFSDNVWWLPGSFPYYLLFSLVSFPLGPLLEMWQFHDGELLDLSLRISPQMIYRSYRWLMAIISNDISSTCLSTVILSNLSCIFFLLSSIIHFSIYNNLSLPFWVIACDVHIDTALLVPSAKDRLQARCDLRPGSGTSLEAGPATATEGEALAEFLRTATRPIRRGRRYGGFLSHGGTPQSSSILLYFSEFSLSIPIFRKPPYRSARWIGWIRFDIYI